MNPLISPEALAEQPETILFDCRFALLDKQAGRRDYEAGHIAGARYADLERDLSSAAGKRGRHPLPDREALVRRLRAWGVSQDSAVVCYDQNAGAFAGRFWWLLRWLGHENVRVLDGGLDAWLAAGYAVDSEIVAPTPGDFVDQPPLTLSCDAEDLLATEKQILDAREPERFRGEAEPIDPVAGHIPGAISAPFSANLDSGRFRPARELRARFAELGVSETTPAICYCGSGVTATHNILALLLAGFPEPVLYPGSWSEWITDPNRPFEREQ